MQPSIMDTENKNLNQTQVKQTTPPNHQPLMSRPSLSSPGRYVVRGQSTEDAFPDMRYRQDAEPDGAMQEKQKEPVKHVMEATREAT